MGQSDLSDEKMRENIRAMLGAMDMTNKEAGEKFGVNASAIGYMTDTKRVKPFYDKVKEEYEKYQSGTR